MTSESYAMYLFAFDAIACIVGFVFTGNFAFFWLTLLFLAFYYSFLEWEFEKKVLNDCYKLLLSNGYGTVTWNGSFQDMSNYGIGITQAGKHVPLEKVYGKEGI